MEKMKARAEEQDYPFPYLKDETQEVYKAYGATKTPQIFLLQNKGGKFKVAYIGAIDDNAMDASSVTRYLENAIAALLSGSNPDPASTKAIGCTIKSKS
jgi:peroxiredoxin